MSPFRPNGSTVNIDVSASSQAVDLGRPDQVRYMNNGSATIWIHFGGSTVTALATAGIPVGPGVTEVLSIPNGLVGADVYVAVIAAGSTGKVYFTPGTGI